MKGFAKMDNYTVNAKTSASSAAAPKLRFSVLPNAKMASEPSLISPLTSLRITGSLPGGRQLTRPLDVVIAYDDGEVVVSEPRFHIHAVGTTKVEALKEFRRILSEELDELTADEEELGPRLRLELQYLRNLII
ncbi:MAG: hypothetical protein E6I91_11100 [Chloroflexi bacterium]|nr:MAG: hypothetical protein E6I91_11100 [Chloroflexota bacterium]